jgi:hypothetical protein
MGERTPARTSGNQPENQWRARSAVDHRLPMLSDEKACCQRLKQDYRGTPGNLLNCGIDLNSLLVHD